MYESMGEKDGVEIGVNKEDLPFVREGRAHRIDGVKRARRSVWLIGQGGSAFF